VHRKSYRRDDPEDPDDDQDEEDDEDSRRLHKHGSKNGMAKQLDEVSESLKSGDTSPAPSL
jgi:hypothetical protein